MPKPEKVGKVEELRERIKASQAILLTEFQGLSVADATELRRALADADARFAVVKNTLMKRAADEAGLAQLEELLQGPTAVTFVAGDPVTAAKKVVDAAKRFPALVLKGAWVEGRILGAPEAQRLATLESREVLLSRIAGMLQSELARTAYALRAVQGRFLAVLEAYREKLPAEAVRAAAGEAEPDSAPSPEEAPAGVEEEAGGSRSAAEGEAPPAAAGESSEGEPPSAEEGKE